jgi:hypothetical protein
MKAFPVLQANPTRRADAAQLARMMLLEKALDR